MSYVESFCDDIALISDGEIILQGKLESIRKQMGDGKLKLRLEDNADLDILAGYEYTRKAGDIILSLNPGESKKTFIQYLLDSDADISLISEYLPSLQEIFIQEVGGNNETI